MNLKEYTSKFSIFADTFADKVVACMADNQSEFQYYIQTQLYAGLDGNDEYLKPTYLNDPWFDNPESGRWYKHPNWYMAWKKKITPPTRSYYLPARPVDVPNLVITGVFYDSIQTAVTNDGLKIQSVGCSFGDDIERKYGSQIFKVGQKSTYEFAYEKLQPAMEAYYKSLGL